MPAFPIIHGASIVAQTRVEITPGEPLTYYWEEHGFEVHVPADAISSESGPVSLSIQASLSGDYQLSDDRVLVSGVYWLALHPPVKFNEKVTITIQHCGTNAESAPLSFVKAKTTPLTPPYKFMALPGGSFSDPRYGVMEVDHFCGFGVSGEKNAPKHYAFSAYYLPKQRNVYEAHITVTPNLDLHLKVGLRSVIIIMNCIYMSCRV